MESVRGIDRENNNVGINNDKKGKGDDTLY
jgi:hypothetical protein